MSEGLYVGLMTGTSMDGIDAALLDTADQRLRLRAAHSVRHDSELRRRLLAVDAATPLGEIIALDAQVGRALAETTLALLDKAGVSRGDVHAIGSHGQTVWHDPDTPRPTTLQIGDPTRIAQATGITVVADFRRRDLAAGGQGAPLAPAFHHAFFASRDEHRVVVNIGGMANLTHLPAQGEPARVVGFDTGPGNVLLDLWHGRHRGGPCDAQGQWAASGRVDPVLLARFLDDPYFRRPPPKSTGRDYFNMQWLERAGVSNHVPSAVQATLAQLTAVSIADAVQGSIPGATRVLVCGGGAHNRDLMGRLAAALPTMTVEDTGSAGIAPDWVEAAGFAWLAREALAGRATNIPAVTGASGPVPMGAIYPGAAR